MKRTSTMTTVSERIARDFLGESKPILDEDDDKNETKDPQTIVKYGEMAGTIVVLLSGIGTKSVRELPIGQVSKFSFHNYTDPEAFWTPKKNIDKYKAFMEKYSNDKKSVIDEWANSDTENERTIKAAQALPDFIGVDLVPTKTGLKNPEPGDENKKDGNPKAGDESGRPVAEDESVKEPVETKQKSDDGEKDPEKIDPEDAKKAAKKVDPEMARNMKVVMEGIQEEETQGKLGKAIGKKIEESGKKDQIDQYIRKVFEKVLGNEGYERFKEKVEESERDGKERPDIMDALKTIPKEKQNEIMSGLQKLEKVVPVGIPDLRKAGVSDEITNAMRKVANEKDGENVDEDLISGIVVLLAGLWGIASGILSLFMQEPLSMTAICVLCYMMGGWKRKRRGSW